jgi:hypothetical protein
MLVCRQQRVMSEVPVIVFQPTDYDESAFHRVD